MKNLIKYGFKEPVKDDRDYVFGGVFSLPKVVRNPSGNWATYLPLFEKQHGSNWDSYGCTVYGTQNAFETILHLIEEIEHNFDERYNYNLINLEPPGADPKEAAQSIHEYGMTEGELPFIDDLQRFRSPRPITEELKAKGRKILEKYDFGYEWVYEGEIDRAERLKRIKECLTYSPLGVSVTAWHKNSDGEYYSPEGSRNNHWCLAFRVDELNRIWVFDTYDQSIKPLSTDHDIQYCMRYHVGTLKELAEKVSLLSKIVEALKSIFSLKKKIQEMEYIPLPESLPTNPQPVKPEPKYLWDSHQNVRLSIRKIADEEGLTPLQKDLACDIAYCESGYDPKAKLVNTVKSIDRGLFQINSYWHKHVTDEMAYNPEFNARWGCRGIKEGKAVTYWNASKKCWNASGKYNSLINL